MWTEELFVIEHSERVFCLICQEKIAVNKEYTIKRHYFMITVKQYTSVRFAR